MERWKEGGRNGMRAGKIDREKNVEVNGERGETRERNE
jgi:hypothetical protein